MAVLPMPWLAEWLAVSEANLFYSPIFYVLISCNLVVAIYIGANGTKAGRERHCKAGFNHTFCSILPLC